MLQMHRGRATTLTQSLLSTVPFHNQAILTGTKKSLSKEPTIREKQNEVEIILQEVSFHWERKVNTQENPQMKYACYNSKTQYLKEKSYPSLSPGIW